MTCDGSRIAHQPSCERFALPGLPAGSAQREEQLEPSERTRQRVLVAIIVIVLLSVTAEIAIRLLSQSTAESLIVHRALYPVSIIAMSLVSAVFLRIRRDSYWRVAFTLAAFFLSLYLAELFRLFILPESVVGVPGSGVTASASPVPWLLARSFVYVAVLVLLGIFWFVDGGLSVTRPRVGSLRANAAMGRCKTNWLVLLPLAPVLAVACGIAMSVHLRDKPHLFMHFIPHYLPSKVIGALNNAFAEEILFRAILLQAFRKAVGDKLGNMFQAAVFAGGHVAWGPLGIVACGLAGYFIWGKSALQTRGILWAVITHAAAVLGLVVLVGW